MMKIKDIVTGRRLLSIILSLALAAGLSSAGTGVAKEQVVSQKAINVLGALSDALAEVAEVAKPAVVNISTTSTVTQGKNPFGDLFNDPLFRRFFGDQGPHGPQQRQYKSSALGSGVIVSEDGYILTNNHVVKKADEIKVVLSDKREFKGTVVGTDPRTDLAVIKIDAKDLPSLKLGDSSKLRIGDVVMAVGNPFGLSQTITMGIVSAVGRSNIGLADLEDFIQTDAAINPGNSGGALVNTSGELIGINTAIFSTSGGYMGIGFAIPSAMVKSVMESIIKTGKVIRGWMGVSIQTLTTDLAESLGLKGHEGALISGVEKDSPADKAGFKRGDLVIALDEKPITDATGLRNMVSSMSPDTKVEVKIIRDGSEQTISLTLGEFPDTAKKSGSIEYDNALNKIGVQELTPALRARLNIPENVSGVAVSAILPDSPARGILHLNDIIQEVGRKPVASVEEFKEAASKIGKEDTVLLLVYRGGGSIYVTIKPE